jgi:Transposase DDE domain
VDGQTKNAHLQEMFVNALDQQQSKARTILFEGWYASAENLKLIHRRNWTFFTTLKSKRVVSVSKEQGYLHREEIEWTPEGLTPGGIVKVKEVPVTVRLFKLVAPDGAIDWVSTNDFDETITAQVAEATSDVRWQVEELHRGLQQLTGSEKCQCRMARAQRHPLACGYQAWVSLKVKAKELGQTLYELRSSLFSAYLRAELRHPRIAAC